MRVIGSHVENSQVGPDSGANYREITADESKRGKDNMGLRRKRMRQGQVQDAAGTPTPFAPAAAGVVDLEKPLTDRDFGVAASGILYGSVLLLVRLHGDPLAAVEVPLCDGRIQSHELSQRLWEGARSQIEAHIRIHRCVSLNELSAELVARGLPSCDCPARVPEVRPAPYATVVVPTARRGERILKCIESLTAMSYDDFEILVVDNAPDDPRTRTAVAAYARRDGRVRYVAEPLPGSSLARNRGLVEARGEIVAYTDDDIIVDPEWLSWMVEPFVTDAEVGVVTGLVMPAGFETPTQRWLEEWGGFGKGFERRVYDTGANRPPSVWLFPYWGAPFGTGASMAFKRSVLLEIGGFDPALGTGSPALAGADIESFSHAIIRGSRLVYEPRAVGWHDHRATEAGVRRQTFTYAVGGTAILTKWALRKPTLFGEFALQAAKLMREAVGGAISNGGSTSRFLTQTRMNRGEGMIRRQFAGYAMGPLLYVRSVAWARRLKLRDVVRNAAGS